MGDGSLRHSPDEEAGTLHFWIEWTAAGMKRDASVDQRCPLGSSNAGGALIRTSSVSGVAPPASKAFRRHWYSPWDWIYEIISRASDQMSSGLSSELIVGYRGASRAVLGGSVDPKFWDLC